MELATERAGLTDSSRGSSKLLEWFAPLADERTGDWIGESSAMGSFRSAESSSLKSKSNVLMLPMASDFGAPKLLPRMPWLTNEVRIRVCFPRGQVESIPVP